MAGENVVQLPRLKRRNSTFAAIARQAVHADGGEPDQLSCWVHSDEFASAFGEVLDAVAFASPTPGSRP